MASFLKKNIILVCCSHDYNKIPLFMPYLDCTKDNILDSSKLLSYKRDAECRRVSDFFSPNKYGFKYSIMILLLDVFNHLHYKMCKTWFKLVFCQFFSFFLSSFHFFRWLHSVHIWQTVCKNTFSKINLLPGSSSSRWQ